jgi:hypothetical protein
MSEQNGTKRVFANVKHRLQANDPARSLWDKVEQELGTGGTSAALTYLRARFSDLSTRIRSEANRVDSI